MFLPRRYFQRVTLGDDESQARIFAQATARPDTSRLDEIHRLGARLSFR